MKIIGNRTYLMGIALMLHQILKVAGIDIPQENLSLLLDGILSVGVILFRALANKENKRVMKI